MFTIDKLREKMVREAIRRGEHLDGRDLEEYRPIRVELNFSPVAEGSALIYLGEEKATKVLAGVKAEIETPYESSPEEGFINVSADRTPFASPVKLRDIDDEDIVVARVVDRAIRSAESVPVEDLVIEAGSKVWGIYIGLEILDNFGNVMDASGLAALAALKVTKIPRVIREGENIILDDSSREPLKLRNHPVLVSVYRIENRRVLDPTFEEEYVADLRLTFGITEDNEICAIQKSGPGLFSLEEFEEALDIALGVANMLRNKILRGF